MHHPEEVFQKVGKAVVISKLEIRQGFLQILIAEVAKTTGVGNRLMAYLHMPYGLQIAPAHFQRAMDIEQAFTGLDRYAASVLPLGAS